MPSTPEMRSLLDDVRDGIATNADPRDQALAVAAALEDAFEESGWLEEELPDDPAGRYDLYVDDDVGYPDPGFLVMTGVTEPGSESGGAVAHDHGAAWVVYGVYRGRMGQTRYRWTHEDDTADPRLAVAEQFEQGPGSASVVLPGEIHETENLGEETTWAVRIESQDLSGVARHWYDVEGNEVTAS